MSSLPIFYDPTETPGTEGAGPEGTPVQFVSGKEYYTRMLGFRMNVTLIFLSLNMPDRVAPEEILVLDDAVAEAYWKTYEGILIPPRIRHLLRAGSEGPSGAHWLARAETLKNHMIEADSMETATELHGVARVEMLLDGASRKLSDFQVAAGELMADYFLLQRAIREDVLTAEARRSPGQSRAAILEGMDRSAELAFEKAIATIHRLQMITEAIPQSRKAEIEKFARGRENFSSTGLFTKLESERFGF